MCVAVSWMGWDGMGCKWSDSDHGYLFTCLSPNTLDWEDGRLHTCNGYHATHDRSSKVVRKHVFITWSSMFPSPQSNYLLISTPRNRERASFQLKLTTYSPTSPHPLLLFSPSPYPIPQKGSLFIPIRTREFLSTEPAAQISTYSWLLSALSSPFPIPNSQLF